MNNILSNNSFLEFDELDLKNALLTRQIIGANVVYDTRTCTVKAVGKEGGLIPLPNFYGDIGACAVLVEAMEELGFRFFHRKSKGQFHSSFKKLDDKTYLFSKADTLAESICLAAESAYAGTNFKKPKEPKIA